MGLQPNPYPLRVAKDVMQKTKIIAAYNGRSVNKEIEFRLREAIEAFEQQHGPIQLPDPAEEEE